MDLESVTSSNLSGTTEATSVSTPTIGGKESVDAPPTSHEGDQQNKKPWIRYRIEYRDNLTDQILYESESKDANTVHVARVVERPPFEEVKTFKVTPWRGESPDEALPANTGATVPSLCVRILSPAIINALQSVVKYYPDQNLTGNIVEVRYPYPILAHHYDQLAKFAEECEKKDKESLCVREIDAASHLRLLLGYLDDTVMEAVRAEQERNRRGFYTFEGFWVGHKPGRTTLQSTIEDEDIRRAVVHSIRGGTFVHPHQDWYVTYWSFAYDGTSLGRVMSSVKTTRKFDGEKKMTEDVFLLVGDGEKIDCAEEHRDLVDGYIREGEAYWGLLKKQCKYYNGKSRSFPYNKVNMASRTTVLNANHR